MRTRRLLAAAVLAALPLVAGTLDVTSTQHAIEGPDHPRWLHALGVDWDFALLLGQRLAGCWACPAALGIAR